MLLKLAYLTLTLVVCFLLTFIAFYAINSTFESQKRAKKKYLVVFGLLSFNLYIYLLAISGFIQTLTFPPRFALTMIFPAFAFTGVFLYKNRNSDWVMNIPKHWLFYFQSFRILVESIFVMSVTAGVLHVEATIEGYNFDMAYAITIPILGFLIFNGKALSLRTALIWNYVGLLVLASVIFVFMTTIFAPQIYGSDTPLMPLEGLAYPYVLVAGFLMPAAVFIHVLSVVQLRRALKS